jgi:hypothetical protein
MSNLIGRHKARAEALDCGLSGDDNTETVSVDLRIVEGHAKGQMVTAYLYFSEKAGAWSADRLRAIGFQGRSLSELTMPGTNKPAFAAAECDIDITEEQYDGKSRLKVNILTGKGGFKQKMDDRQRRSFAARFDHLLQGGDASPASTGQRPARDPWDANRFDQSEETDPFA